MTDDMKSSAEDPQTQEEEPDAVSQDEVTDEFVDEVSESLLESDAVATAEAEEGEGEEQAEEEEPELEEEKVKDEIDIQIDLLQDPDWVVRREAVVTLGEMGDERCVAAMVRTLLDGDWQVREAAVEAIAEVGSPPSSCCSGTCAIGRPGSTRSRHWGRSMMSGCWIP